VGERARAAWQRAGLRGLFFGACAVTCYRRLLLLDRPLASPPARIEAPRGVEVLVLGTSDAAAYAGFREEQGAGEFLRRVAAGATCFVAVHGGRVVGTTWARPGGGPAAYLGREIRLGEGDVYLFDTFVLPEWRGRRVAPAIAAAQIAFYRPKGVRRLVSTVLPENGTSLRARARTGFAVYGVTGYVGVGSWRWHFERRFRARMELST